MNVEKTTVNSTGLRLTTKAILRYIWSSVCALLVFAPLWYFSSENSIVAQQGKTFSVRNVVLVHGDCADGSSCSEVIPILQARGMHEVAVQAPLTGLADDVTATKRAIALQDGPILLAGHSNRGVAIPEAGNDPRDISLVCVASFAPDQGESTNSIYNDFPSPIIGSEIGLDDDGFLTLTPKGIAGTFTQDLGTSEKENLTATQGPTPPQFSEHP